MSEHDRAVNRDLARWLLEHALRSTPGRTLDLRCRYPFLVRCLADLGWTLGVRDRTDPTRVRPGTHGFDPDAPEMRAVFIGWGPSFAAGVRVPSMDSVDVQPLLGGLLGIRVPVGDGAAGDTAGALRQP